MLVLERRVGEEVSVGDPKNPLGVFMVTKVHGDKVWLSFDFPRDVPVHRREVAAAIRRGEIKVRK